MASAFNESIEAINITVTVYMIVQGLCACSHLFFSQQVLEHLSVCLAPSIWGTIADRKGRRLSFILCLLLLMATSVGLALTPTSAYWLLVVLRCVQAGGSASTVALSKEAIVLSLLRD